MYNIVQPGARRHWSASRDGHKADGEHSSLEAGDYRHHHNHDHHQAGNPDHHHLTRQEIVNSSLEELLKTSSLPPFEMPQVPSQEEDCGYPEHSDRWPKLNMSQCTGICISWQSTNYSFKLYQHQE